MQKPAFLASEKLQKFFKRVGVMLIPSLLIAGLSIYAMTFKGSTLADPKVLPGKPLAAYEALYPIQADTTTGALYLDRDRFIKAVNELSDNSSPRAVADLLYLGNANHVQLWLDAITKKKYEHLADLPDYAMLADVDRQRDQLLQSYKDIVNGIGMTFAGTPMEIVLHDTRNPMQSIVAVQNTITGRRIGGANTNFGVQLIKNYSTVNTSGNSFISYELMAKDGRKIKSSTIPIFHPIYGLVAFICINVDLSKVNTKNAEMVDRFIENFKLITPNDAIEEMIENSKIKK